jgi:hypothetical protein
VQHLGNPGFHPDSLAGGQDYPYQIIHVVTPAVIPSDWLIIGPDYTSGVCYDLGATATGVAQ